MSITEKSRFAQFRRNWTSRIKALHLDSKNRKRFGARAPLFAERLWIPVNQIEWRLKHWNSKQSGRVVSEWPTEKLSPVSELSVVRACQRHWLDGVPWEQTGLFDQMIKSIQQSGKVDRMRSMDDIRLRYEQLDDIFDQVRTESIFRTRQSLITGCFREEGGILMHIGPDGAPYFGGKGHHRLAIALCAGIEVIPAQLGVVHIDALAKLDGYRYC